MERKLRITVNGRQYDVTVEDLSAGESRTIPGPGDMRVPAAEPPAAPDAASPELPEAGPGDEVSPLAGVIESIHVTLGQPVKPGDKLATLEAMKMKTLVYAHHSGEIKRIAFEVGDPVDAAQVLFTIG